MKQLKQFFAVTLLVATLGISAYAGEMDTPGYVPPPPPSSSAAMPGDMDTPTYAAPAPGDMEGPTLVTMGLESILGVLALYVY
jgi:hypothetical protein